MDFDWLNAFVYDVSIRMWENDFKIMSRWYLLEEDNIM